jgi:DNA-directed RNA polymerase specialized sigma54-like protein
MRKIVREKLLEIKNLIHALRVKGYEEETILSSVEGIINYQLSFFYETKAKQIRKVRRKN